MLSKLLSRTPHFILTLSIALSPFVTASAPASPGEPPQSVPHADKVIFFASDGMRPDLMERYADEGAMPT